MADNQPHNQAEAPVAAAPSEIYFPVTADERLFQGELVERVSAWAPAYDEANRDVIIGVQPHLQALSLIVSQDCDLAQDFEKRREDIWLETDLRSVLLCPAYPAEDLRKRQNLSSRKWESVRQNKDERYAYLAEVQQASDSAGAGHPAILLDLANYFTTRTPELYRQIRVKEAHPRCRLQTPWREHMQSRFAAYLARIGLPRDHFIPENRKQVPPPEISPG